MHLIFWDQYSPLPSSLRWRHFSYCVILRKIGWGDKGPRCSKIRNRGELGSTIWHGLNCKLNCGNAPTLSSKRSTWQQKSRPCHHRSRNRTSTPATSQKVIASYQSVQEKNFEKWDRNQSKIACPRWRTRKGRRRRELGRPHGYRLQYFIKNSEPG